MMRGVAFLSLPSLVLAGCATTTINVPEAAIDAPAAYAADLPPAGADALWWQAFSDPVLDELIARGLAANLDIIVARDRLRAAEALLEAERADRLPSVDGAAEAGVELDDGGARSTASAGLFGSFDPDFSGRLRAEIRAAAARYAEADYLRADQRRLVAAAIASQYVEYRRTGAQLALLEESTNLQRQTLRIVTLRFEAGLSANLDVRRAAADLAQTQARLGLIEIARGQAENALAVLLGETPGRLVIAPPGGRSTIPDYGQGPPIGGPANLLRRRGDVLAAEARLAAAAARVGIEQADLRPSLVVPGSILIGDGTVGGVFSQFLASLGAALDLPLFDGGRRRAEVDAARAELDASLAEYRQTFLEALGEAENALTAIDAYRQRAEALAEAIEQSETALGQSNALYREGLASLFDVLDAQRQLISSRQSLLDNEADLANAFIALHMAAASDNGGTSIPSSS
ncbi:efflux transporter outer membrane subunit [Pseudoblastomonas halimionae]|uniref:Efflux transporter outer membrane subunit n=1 Tax=Alteriqipengyuania halimionae TaxID=1926630 RepID=A0A6I4U343_9SPHN|nr:efflux transporter outer membrane subunit [Alteriqipengyuania halimionae]MXP10348.1 efflux transporter outer membrane subunit [Alteriqipengyuania halimionae]